MSSWLFFKVFGDACLYFSIIGAFPMLFLCRYAFYLPALLCGASAMIAKLLEKLHPTLRYLGCLLPLSALFLAGNTMEYLVLLPVIAYALAVIIRSDHQLEYYRFLSFFKKSILLWICFLLIILLISALLDTFGEGLNFGTGTSLRYGVLSFVSGVLLLRSLRLGNLVSQNVNRKQLIVTAGGVGAFMLIAVMGERALMKHGLSIVEFLLNLFKTLLALPIYFVLLIFGLLSKTKNKSLPESTLTESISATEVTNKIDLPAGDSMTSVVEQIEKDSFPWWLVGVIIAILAIVLFFMFRLHQHRQTQMKTYESSQALPKNKKSKAATDSNRSKIRRHYREFLKYEKTKGLKLHTDQTSLDILENLPHGSNRQASAKLREFYLSARYDDESEITRQQLDDARAALKKIRK